MNKFQEIKKMLKNEEVVEKYLGVAEKHNSTGNWYKSPFRKEKTASFCVSAKGIHDFGDSMHYDVISFTQRYFKTTPIQAIAILCRDFNLALDNEYETEEITKRLKQKREEERQIKAKIDKWFNEEFQSVCDEIIANRKCLKIYEKGYNAKVLKILYDEQVKLEFYFAILFEANETAEEKIYLQNH